MKNFNVYPGLIIKKDLECMNMSAKEFAFRTGISERTLSAIMNDKGAITFDVAYKLSQYFDSSIEFWLRLQSNYDLENRKNSDKNLYKKEYEKVQDIKDFLIKNNFIDEKDNKKTIVKKCKEAIGVTNLLSLDSYCFHVSSNNKEDNKSNLFYRNFWLCLALKEARKQIDKPYNKEKLLSSMEKIKKLSFLPLNDSIDILDTIFKETGVSFIKVPYLKEANISGATKWFNKKEVMVAISYNKDNKESFWFALFNELEHLFMESRRVILVSEETEKDLLQEQASLDLLIPKDKREKLYHAKNNRKAKWGF